MSDHVISNNLVVLGMSTFAGGQTFDGQTIIDVDSAEALLVREDGDTGDVFIVNTVTASATLPHANSFISLGPNASATGDIRFGNTRFIAWRNMNNNGDVQALSVDEDDFLNIGSAAALQARILSPSFVVLTVGPHTIGTSPPQNHRQLRMAGNFVSGGQGTSATNFHMETDLTGFSGDTTFLAGFAYQGAITTQAVAEVIASVSSMQLDEPAITLGGGSSITRASTLNITGHPTEGGENFALIAQGPVEIADTSTRALTISQDGFGTEILFVDTNNDEMRMPTGSFFALSGTIGAAGFTVTSLIQWTDANAPRINNVASTATVPPILPNRAAATTGIGGVSGEISLIVGGVEAVNIDSAGVVITGTLAVSGAGPHSIAGVTFGAVQLLIGSTFTSDGASDIAAGLFHTPAIVGAPGDTAALTGTTLTAGITTQTATESIANIAQLQINEPNITDNLTGDITQASTVLITGAPTEGLSNFALLVISGLSEFGGTVQAATGAGPAILNETSSAVNPTLIPNRLNLITGIGGVDDEGGDILNLIVESTNIVDLTTARVQMIPQVEIFAGSSNGEKLNVQQISTTVAPSGPSVTAAGLIPLGSFVVGITTRVLTTVTGPSGFDIGDGSDVDRWGNSIAVAAGTTTSLEDATAEAHGSFASANDVVITSDGVDFTGGSIRITVNYFGLTPPTS